MSENSIVHLGIIGMGSMGSDHAAKVEQGLVPGLRLAAVADQDSKRLEKWSDARHFNDGSAMIQSGEVDAVLIATPHYSHTTLGIEALEAGLHVLVEKPISVHKADCQRLIDAWTNPKQVFAAMFNQRTNPAHVKLREMIQNGELGEIQRMQWTVTTWFRTEHYYRTGDWRATWSGEGGGVLLNQCPHNLDLLQWLFGMPKKVYANCQFGRFHDIEVEDAVTAMLEFESGATGVFITTTGEAPGSNRLEVAADRGKILIENDKLHFTRTEIPVSEFSRTSEIGFARPPVWEIDIPVAESGEQHLGILKNFANAILNGEPLLAPASEGIHSVELANAMLYSAFESRAVELPIDAAAYQAALKAKVENSTYVKPETVTSEVADLSGSF
ncbi:MAG TPA: Gfo/Idh/MocA family oxidoreductase [Opitutales bacterium]|nr:Gfo/Idh/MocA family oxidoreductase [Opitutales bacterium]